MVDGVFDFVVVVLGECGWYVCVVVGVVSLLVGVVVEVEVLV